MPGIVEDRVHEGFQGPPQTCGLVWDHGRIVFTRRGERRLTKAPSTLEFAKAWQAADSDLDEIGFSWEDASTVAFWERRDLDPARVTAVIDSLPARVAQAQAEAARRAEEARQRWEREQAERQERERQFIADAVEAARVSLRERRWSWAKGALIDEAHELMSKADIDRVDALRLLALVEAARKNVTRAEDRTSRPHVPEMERASDPAILTAARVAIEAITLQDQDWASVQNAVGWSKSTTVDGHVLSGLETWTPEQASHALRLLRVHRRQIPEHLRQTLFPAAQLSLSRAA